MGDRRGSFRSLFIKRKKNQKTALYFFYFSQASLRLLQYAYFVLPFRKFVYCTLGNITVTILLNCILLNCIGISCKNFFLKIFFGSFYNVYTEYIIRKFHLLGLLVRVWRRESSVRPGRIWLLWSSTIRYSKNF